MGSLRSRGIAVLAGSVLMSVAVAAWAEPEAKRPAANVATTRAHASTVRGVVKSVSGTRLVLDTGRPGSGSELRLVLDDTTVLQKGVGKPITAKDLKAGDPVTVSYRESDGKTVAKRVWVRSSGPAAPSGGAGASRAR